MTGASGNARHVDTFLRSPAITGLGSVGPPPALAARSSRPIVCYAASRLATNVLCSSPDASLGSRGSSCSTRTCLGGPAKALGIVRSCRLVTTNASKKSTYKPVTAPSTENTELMGTSFQTH